MNDHKAEVMPGVLQAKDAPMSLGARLVKAQSIARAVGKDGFNKFQGYRYASSEAVIEEARGALTEAGIAVYGHGWTYKPVDEPQVLLTTNNKGQEVDLMKGHAGDMLIAYEMTDGSETWTFSTEQAVIVESGRPLDKAQATALTYNLAYFLRSLLLLPREDESESVDARDDRHQDRPATRQSAPQREEEPSYTAEQILGMQNEVKALCGEMGLTGPAMHKHLSKLADGKAYTNSYPLLLALRDKLQAQKGTPQ